ncbi:MAG: family 16 glycoside hydrolase [Bryobacterales bacterium]|nr:family 16 glycoside hydrolase [Bryobacterales bacterium]
MRTLCCLFALFISGCGAALSAPAAGPWISLFDGKTLQGWKANENADTFRVEKGSIVASGPRSHLFYVGPGGDATFRNFEFEAEAMTEPGANSGIYFHTAFQQKGWPSQGFEVQVNSSHLGEGNYRERKKTGSLYGIRNQYKALANDGEWVKLSIRVEDKRVQVRVNGILTVDYVEPIPPVEQPGDAAGRVIGDGTFALQGHDAHSTARFRNLRVRRLPDSLKTPASELPVVDQTYRKILELSRANVPVVDYHTHLKGTLTLEDLLQRTYRDGIYAGIAVNGGKGFPIESDAGVEAFRKSMEGKAVFIAMQAEGREWVELFSPQAVAKFDYVFTDSMTWTDDSGKRMRLWMPNEVGEIKDPQAFMDTLVARTVRILSEEPVDIYVNPTFLPAAIAANYDQLWTSGRMDKVIAAAKQHEVAIEINNRYRIPSEAFLSRAKDAGVLFTCGTNNGGAEDLKRMEYCLEIIGKLDLKWQNFWVPGVYGEKAALRKPWPKRAIQ